MPSSARLYNCARCRCQVVICRHCDRGNIYCGEGCAQAARRQSQREAARRYGKTRRARLLHAQRQRRYRQRRTAKVTHQGSPPSVLDATLPGESSVAVQDSDGSARDVRDGIPCHFCGRVCSHLLRQSFLHRRPRGEVPTPIWVRNRGP